MSNARKRRARNSEFDVADYLAENGWPRAEAVNSGASGSDIKHTEPIPWEVKARRGFNPKAAMKQASARPGDFHPCVLRVDGMGPASIEQWPAVLPFGELVRLLRLAGYGEPTS